LNGWLKISVTKGGIFLISTMQYETVALIISEVAPAKLPYSPFQNTSNLAEYALARLDDLLNWGRKVTYPVFGYFSISFPLAIDV
jgi:hypothetical protein